MECVLHLLLVVSRGRVETGADERAGDTYGEARIILIEAKRRVSSLGWQDGWEKMRKKWSKFVLCKNEEDDDDNDDQVTWRHTNDGLEMFPDFEQIFCRFNFDSRLGRQTDKLKLKLILLSLTQSI